MGPSKKLSSKRSNKVGEVKFSENVNSKVELKFCNEMGSNSNDSESDEECSQITKDHISQEGHSEDELDYEQTSSEDEEQNSENEEQNSEDEEQNSEDEEQNSEDEEQNSEDEEQNSSEEELCGGSDAEDAAPAAVSLSGARQALQRRREEGRAEVAARAAEAARLQAERQQRRRERQQQRERQRKLQDMQLEPAVAANSRGATEVEAPPPPPFAGRRTVFPEAPPRRAKPELAKLCGKRGVRAVDEGVGTRVGLELALQFRQRSLFGAAVKRRSNESFKNLQLKRETLQNLKKSRVC